MTKHFQYDQNKLAEICKRFGISRLSFFGSVLRDDFGPESDIDVIVEFEPGKTPGLRFFDIQEELAVLFQRPADVHTPKSLSKYIREKVLQSAELQYVAA